MKKTFLSLLIYFTSGNKLSLTGPFIRTSKNAIKVDSNKTNPIIFINESSDLLKDGFLGFFSKTSVI